MRFMLENGSQLTRPCVHLPYKDSIWIMITGETTWGSEEGAEQAPSLPLTLWETAASCWFFSTLGQTRNHSPVWKPPILKDVGNLEQETTITQTLTLLTPSKPHSLEWMERLQRTETVLPAQVSGKPHTPDNLRSGKGMWHFKISKRHPFFPKSSLSCTCDTRKPHLFCSPRIPHFNANPSGWQNAVVIV